MHCSTSKYNTHCKMTYVQTCSLTMTRLLQVEYLLMISPSFFYFPHVSTILVSMPKVTPPYTSMSGKKGDSFQGQGFILEFLPMVSFFEPYFYHGLEIWVAYVTMIIWFHSSISLLHIQYEEYVHLPYMYTQHFLAFFHLFINKTIAS